MTRESLRNWRAITNDIEKYAAYLCSREWAVKRRAVEQRCGGRCERCRSSEMECVHHLTHARKYQELLEDLLGICNSCHRFIHGKSDHDPAAMRPISDAPRARRLPVWDREVLEMLVVVPDSVGLIVSEVGPADVETPACRTVIETAGRLHAEGRRVALTDLLSELVDPALQGLLVAIDESAAERRWLDPRERVSHFTEALRRRDADRQAHVAAQALKTGRLDKQAEDEALERLLAERRVAQGMPLHENECSDTPKAVAGLAASPCSHYRRAL